MLTDIEVLALLTSCLVHDLEHKGTTNSFEVATGSSAARTYNDVSVVRGAGSVCPPGARRCAHLIRTPPPLLPQLENHHMARAWALFECTGVFSPMSDAERRALRRLIIGAVLSTDSARG
jgi:hypothetical protein